MQSAKQSLCQSLSAIKENTSNTLALIDSKIQAASSRGLLFVEVELDFNDRHTVITTLTEAGYTVNTTYKETDNKLYLFIGWDIL